VKLLSLRRDYSRSGEITLAQASGLPSSEPSKQRGGMGCSCSRSGESSLLKRVFSFKRPPSALGRVQQNPPTLTRAKPDSNHIINTSNVLSHDQQHESSTHNVKQTKHAK